jgi:hypothetical protein
MNDGAVRCPHGNKASLVPRPDLGEGWVQKVADGCGLCEADPDFARQIPYKPGEPQKPADGTVKSL